jgi:transaldolase
MKIFLATARTDDVSWGAAHGMLDGVLTTPGLLAVESRGDARTHLLELCRLVHGPIFAAVQSIDSEGAYRDGRDLARISDQIVVQIPLVEETLGTMRRLHTDGIRVAATHVYSTAQALLAARTGAFGVVTFLDQLDAAGHDSIGVVRDIRLAFDSSDAECDVIAVNASSPTQFGACAVAGADAVAISEELCRALLVHPLTDRGVDQFLGDVGRLRHIWSAG